MADLLDPTRGEAAAARGSRAAGRLSAPLICLAAAVAGSGTFLLVLQSHFTFFGDDWEFLLDRRGFSAGAFLDPHNDHIAVAPVSIYKALLALFGMGSVVPFAVGSTLVFLLSAALLFVYVRRRVGDWPALLGSILILFLGAASSDLLWSFQIGYSGSIAAGLGALLALDRDDRDGDLVACALLVTSTAFSELGVPFTVGALVSVALGPSPRFKRLYVALVPFALYGLWYLGWGHTGPKAASFHNLVNSPRFVFDEISENLVSLLGLATPLTGNAGNPNLGGLTWGRILLVMAIGLAAWRLWRLGEPSRRLWAILAAGGSFWFLTALNAIPVLRTPTSGRYQYPGAVFVVLIAAELLRGVRVGKRVVIAATVVTVAAAISGVIFLHEAYDIRRAASENLRARLAAVEIGRGHESRDLIIALHPFILRPASSYFSAVDAFGSPAFSEAELAASDEKDRAAADGLLARAEGITLSPAAANVGRGGQAAGRCQTFNGSPSSSPALAVGPGTYTLSARKPPAGAAQGGAQIQAARFADAPLVNLGLVPPRAALTIPDDRSNREWRLYWPRGSAVTVCNGVA